MSLLVRPGQESDLHPLRQLAIDSFTSAYAQFNTEEDIAAHLSEYFSEKKLLRAIESGEILLGVEGKKIVAYAQLVEPRAGSVEGHHPLEIARLYTDAALIGRGIGKQMIAAIDSEARRRGYDSVCLGTWQKNFRGINFYQREGFRICGLTQFRLGNDVQDDFVMIRNLSL